MSNFNAKDFQNLSREERLKYLNEMMDLIMAPGNDTDQTEVMMNLMPRMMGSGMPMMKKMCEQLKGNSFFDRENKYKNKENPDTSCCGKKEDNKETPEIKALFEDWVQQVQVEIDRYREENKNASNKEIAEYLKLSEQSLDYFIKDKKNEAPASCCSSTEENKEKGNYEVVRIEKISSVCPMCENYAKQQADKPVVVMSCEGACLRGEVARRSANILCHTLAEDKTVRLCLGGAFTKDGGQRNLVKNGQKVLALEGCFIKCASRMMKGVAPDAEPEIIVTDQLFDFDASIFGINEMPDAEIQAKSLEVAKQIAEKYL